MHMRIGIAVAAFAASEAGLAGGPALAQDKTASPKWSYGYDFRVRPGGASDFDAKTPKIAVEFFRDEANGALLALSETGSLAVTPNAAVETGRKVDWITAHDLRARKATEAEFTQKTKQYGVELNKDLASNNLLYVCESGSIAFAPVPAKMASDKGPKWHHAIFLKVRGPNEQLFDKAKKFGVEVFKDENTGGLVYITEAGAIATAAAPPAAPDKAKVKDPKAVYGLVFKVRKADEANFTDATRRIDVEVFEDPNTDALLYISESGAIAAAPRSVKAAADAQGVTWKSAQRLKARKGGEKSFALARSYGVEVFQDNRTGNTVYVCETGSVAVLPKRN